MGNLILIYFAPKAKKKQERWWKTTRRRMKTWLQYLNISNSSVRKTQKLKFRTSIPWALPSSNRSVLGMIHTTDILHKDAVMELFAFIMCSLENSHTFWIQRWSKKCLWPRFGGDHLQVRLLQRMSLFPLTQMELSSIGTPPPESFFILFMMSSISCWLSIIILMELNSPREVLIVSSGFTTSKQEVWSSSLKVVELESQVIPIEFSALSSIEMILTW